MFRRSVIPRVFTAVLAGMLVATPAWACPPTISVVRSSSGSSAQAGPAFLIIRASRGCHQGRLTVSGTAHGVVAGARRSIPLEIAATDSDGIYQVNRQWPGEGVWALYLVVTVGADSATALVGIGREGRIAVVREPRREGRAIINPSQADVEALLRSLDQNS